MISHISLVHSPMKRSFMKPIWSFDNSLVRNILS
jgi:hypothetical protein